MIKTLLLLLTALAAAAHAITLSGTVTLSPKGTPMSAVAVRLQGNLYNGRTTIPFDSIVTTSSTGAYLFNFGTLPAGVYWSGVLTPRRSGYTFTPASKTFLEITTSQKQDFSGAATVYFTITATADSNGTITPAGAVSVAQGSTAPLP
jgi:hypothetical protein